VHEVGEERDGVGEREDGDLRARRQSKNEQACRDGADACS
jgi:hypothetical protein